MRRSELPCLLAELQAHGVQDYRVEPGSKHPKLIFTYAGRQITFVFSRTPSDIHGYNRSLALLRRLMGIRPPAKRRSVHPPRHAPARPQLPPLPVMAERPDPWAKLAGWAR